MKFLLIAIGLFFAADCAVQRRRPAAEAEVEPVEQEPLEQ
jgi:hypothetical protein